MKQLGFFFFQVSQQALLRKDHLFYISLEWQIFPKILEIKMAMLPGQYGIQNYVLMDISKEHISIFVKLRVNGLSPRRRGKVEIYKILFQLFFPLPQEKWPNKKNTVFLPENYAFLLSVHLSFISLIVMNMVVEVIPI